MLRRFPSPTRFETNISGIGRLGHPIPNHLHNTFPEDKGYHSVSQTVKRKFATERRAVRSVNDIQQFASKPEKPRPDGFGAAAG